LTPHRQGTFKVSRDPAFAEKVADIVGLYLDPPGGAVVLSLDEKTQIQALDRTQPLLPIGFDTGEKRTHGYVRHGTTNLFAALNVGTGEVFGECKPTRNGADFLAFLKKAVKPHTGKDIHVVLDNLSTHNTPDVQAWLAKNPRVQFHFTPVGSSWINQIETWFGIITRQSIRRERLDQPDPRLPRALEHQPQTIHLDRHRRRNPRQGQTRPNQHQETRRQQRQVKLTGSRGKHSGPVLPCGFAV
jgi:transposase